MASQIRALEEKVPTAEETQEEQHFLSLVVIPRALSSGHLYRMGPKPPLRNQAYSTQNSQANSSYLEQASPYK